MYSIASLIISLFLPVIVYSATSSLKLAILFCVFKEAFAGVFTIILKKLIVKNLNISIIVSFIPLIVIQIIAVFQAFSLPMIILLAFFSGITNPLYFIPLNIFFAHFDDKADVAKFETSATIGKIIYLLFAGYLLSSAWQHSLIFLLSLSIVIFTFSMIPLIKNRNSLKNLNLTDSHNLLSTNKMINKKTHFFHSLFGVLTTSVNVVIPLYLFYNNLGFNAVAYMIAIGELLKIAANYITKWLISKNKRWVAYLISSAIISSGFLSLFFTSNPITIFVVSIFVSGSFSMLLNASFGIYVSTIKNNNIVINGLILRDFYILTPRTFVYLLFLVFPDFYFLFIIGIVAGFSMLPTRLDEKNIHINKQSLKY